MTKKSPSPNDRFNEITAELRALIGYNDRENYFTIRLDADTAALREAFSDHVKALYDILGTDALASADYDWVEHQINRFDTSRLKDLQKGDIISTQGAAFAWMEGREGRVCRYDIDDVDSLVGRYYRVAVGPIPVEGEEVDGNGIQPHEFQPVLEMHDAQVEDSSGEMHEEFPDSAIFVPFFYEETGFVKRVYGGK